MFVFEPKAEDVGNYTIVVYVGSDSPYINDALGFNFRIIIWEDPPANFKILKALEERVTFRIESVLKDGNILIALDK
jgi:hypothetical protein